MYIIRLIWSKIVGIPLGQKRYRSALPHIIWNILGPGGSFDNPKIYRYKEYEWTGFNWKYNGIYCKTNQGKEYYE